MAKANKQLQELNKKYGISADDLWDCHGTWVMLHSSCERVAQKAGVRMARPEVLNVTADGKSIAILVEGELDGRKEWSIGEADEKNCMNSYKWAMAEKRAKDRVILKLLGYSEEGVHSDIEAEEEVYAESAKARRKDERDMKMMANRIDSCESMRSLRSLYITCAKDLRRDLEQEFNDKADAFGEPLTTDNYNG